MKQEFLDELEHLLTVEESSLEELKKTRAARQLSAGRKDLLTHLRKLAKSDDLALIIAAEKKIIQGDLSRYANSAAMVSSLKAAMEGMDIIEHHITLASNKTQYTLIDQTHRMAKNRKAGLPFDEARQALAGHHARLMNLDKSRLDEDDKEIIEMRKAVMAHAQECYARRQAATLGIEPPAHRIPG